MTYYTVLTVPVVFYRYLRARQHYIDSEWPFEAKPFRNPEAFLWEDPLLFNTCIAEVNELQARNFQKLRIQHRRTVDVVVNYGKLWVVQ